MAIPIRCSCGKRFVAQDQWQGRRVNCPQCGAMLTLPAFGAGSTAESDAARDPHSDGDVLQSWSSTPRFGDKFLAEPAAGGVKRPGYRFLLWEFPSFKKKTLLRWREPTLYRVRLREDFSRRLAIALAVWAGGTGLFLLLFAFNNNPPGIPWAVFGGMCIGLSGWGAVSCHVSETGGKIDVAKHQIVRVRQSASLRYFWQETTTWPLAGIERCFIVPGEVIGKSFSVMILIVGGMREIVGIREQVNLEALQAHLVAQGVPVQWGRSVPAEYKKPLSSKALIVAAACGTLILFVGFGCYVGQGKLGARPRANDMRFDGARVPDLPQRIPGDNRRRRFEVPLPDTLRHAPQSRPNLPPQRPATSGSDPRWPQSQRGLDLE